MFCIRRDDSASNDIQSWPDLGDKNRVDSLQSPYDQIGLGSELDTTDITGQAVQGIVTGLALIEGHLHVEIKGEEVTNMAEFNQEKALKQYSELMKLIHVGAYDERDHEGNYGADGIEEEADHLIFEAARRGLAFHYHKEEDRYSLEPISAESKAAFLHVNVEQLVSLLAETARYLLSVPYESALDKSYRTGLHERLTEALQQSYLAPVLLEQEESELLEDEDEEDDTGDGSGLHQCPYCYNLVNDEHEEFCSLNPNRNRNIVP